MDNKKNLLEINTDNVGDIYFAFDHFFPEGVIYSADKPYSKGNFYWNNKQEFIEYVKEKTGIEVKDNNKTAIKKAQKKFFDIAEGKVIETETKMVEPPESPVDANTLSPEKLEQFEKEDEVRELKRKEAVATAEQKQASFEKRLEQIKTRVWARPKDKLTEITITPKNKEFIFEMAQAVKLDAGTTQEHIEGIIKASIPKDQIDEYPENLIKNRAHNFVQTVQNFSVYKTANEVPDTLTVTPSYAPLTSLINPNDQKLIDTFTDRFVRENIASDAQQTVLTLSVQRDLDAEIFEPSVFGGDKNLTAIFFGSDEITKFTPDGNEQDGIEITPEDLQTLHKNNVEIQKFFKKYIEIDSGGAEVVSTGFTPLRIPGSEIKSVDTSKVIGKKHILGGIEGEETQGALARRILNEKAKLIDKVISVNPSTNPLVVQKTKTILSKISSEIVPQTIVKNTALSPIRLGINIGSGTTPLSMELSGDFGGSTQSFLKLMRDTNTPLILTSFAIGTYATSDLAITQAIASQFNGRVLVYIGAGKYSFSVVNAGNTTLGGQLLSRYTAGFQLGSKAFSIEFSQKAGKIISSTLIKTAGGATTRTALPAIISKIANFLGVAGGWTSFGITTVIGLGIGKVIEKIPWEKVKKFFNDFKEVIFGAGAFLTLGVGGIGGTIAGVSMMIIGGAAGVAAGGFSTTGITTFVSGLSSIGRFILVTALAGIGKVILFIILGFSLIVALILFIINSGAYVVPPSPLSLSSSASIASPYINVEKTANPAGPFENNQLPFTVEYTITITAKKGQLSDVQVKYDCTVTKKSGSVGCPPVTPAIPTTIAEGISPTTSKSFTYKQTYTTPNFTDSLVADTLTVNAITSDGQKAEASASLGIKIGNPPDQCPNGWPVAGNHVITQTPGGSYSHNPDGNAIEAMDIATVIGTPVRATHSGIAHVVRTSGAYRPVYVTISSVCAGKQFQSWYAHLSAVSVTDGQQVTMGQLLGATGTAGTGAHLHYEFKGLTMGVPYIPKSIQRNCSSDTGACGSIP